VARSRRRLVTSAALAGRAGAGGRRAERVERLLAGESLDTSRLAYDFEAHHLALVAKGVRASEALDGRTAASDCQRLLVEVREDLVWCWLGKRQGFEPAEIDALIATRRPEGTWLTVGEPGQGLTGWRLTHHQARAALTVVLRAADPVARYADVALLASVLRDEMLATSLRRLYLEPLEADPDGGEELRRTLRAYFAADRNATVAGAAIGVTRQAVARRLRAVEAKLGRSIAVCGADLQVALRFEELAPTPLSVP
jgi:sugar diacid utilization regulator